MSIDYWDTTLDGEYLRAFSSFFEGKKINGRLARSVLSSNLAFLLQIDEEWTRLKLVPTFSDYSGDGEEAAAAWNGFLTWGTLTPLVFDTMKDLFLGALPHLHRELEQSASRFVEYYTYIVGYYVDRPNDKWIPEFFKYASIEDRRAFANFVAWHLRNFSEAQQKEWWDRWLRDYLNNRAVGKPSALAPDELEAMLDWAPHLSAVFPECVSAISSLPPSSFRMSSVVFETADSDLPARYPDDIVRLLLFIETCKPERTAWFGIDKIIDKMTKVALSTKTRTQLDELRARLGI